MNLKIKGSLVDIFSREVKADNVHQKTPSLWIQDTKKISVYREIVTSARKLSECNSIKSTCISSIRGIRQSWRRSPNVVYKTVTITRSYRKEKARRKEQALVRKYNSRTYSAERLSETFTVDSATCPSMMPFYQQIKRGVDRINSKVRSIRQYYTEDAFRSKQKYLPKLGMTLTYTTVNGSMAPGELERLSKYIRTQQIWASKKPASTEKHFGVEIECFGPIGRESLGEKLISAKLGRYVELKSDGSVRPNHSSENPFELAIVAPESQLRTVIEKVCEVLSSSRCSVNKSCGLHVHLDARGQNANKMFSNLVSAQSILYMMQPFSRRENTYCEKTLGKDLHTELRKGKRYLGINPMSFRKHSTIEVRLHSGTVDPKKILNFVAILNAVAYKEEYTKRGATTIKGFVKQNKLPLELEQYITERVNKFKTNSSAEEVS